MIIVEPDYYQQFHCAAGACPDTCCAAWEVVIDPETLQFYRSIPDTFGKRVRHALHRADGEWLFRTENGRCPLLTADGLCSIQLRYGHERLCTTCREYPKFVSEFGLLQERGVSLSCPEVCRMLLTREEPVTFSTYENSEPLTGCNEIDAAVFYRLKQARTDALHIAQDRSLSIHQRLFRLLCLSQALQHTLDARTAPNADVPVPAFRPAAAIRALRKGLRILQGLEILTPAWRDTLDLLRAHLSRAARQPARWAEERRRFLASYSAVRQEQLLVYYVYKFFLRSAYHADVLAMTRLIVFCTLIIEALDLAAWEQAGGALPLTVQIENAHRFAREIEHSEENLRALKRCLCPPWNRAVVQLPSLLLLPPEPPHL